jgi:hypothetical protein
MSMTRRLRRPPRLLTLAILLALLSGLLVSSSAIGQAGKSARRSPSAHAAASYLTGIGDEHAKMFNNPLWRQLHTKIARYIAPYDAAARSFSLDQAKVWIHAAEAQHQQILVAFYHSEYTPTKLPSVGLYQHDVQKFIKLFPHVRQYQSWDESNRGNVPHSFASPSATASAKYYQALIRVCKGCTAIGLDVLDQANIAPTLRYISEFKAEISHLQTVMPKIWGLHDYSDVNRLQSFRTHEISQALGGQVWLTETGGIVQFKPEFLNVRGSGLARAAKVLKYMFSVAASTPQVKRLYIFDWSGGTTSTRFDAGLTDAHDKPRPGYVAVCHALHAAKCNVKLSSR